MRKIVNHSIYTIEWLTILSLFIFNSCKSDELLEVNYKIYTNKNSISRKHIRIYYHNNMKNNIYISPPITIVKINGYDVESSLQDFALSYVNGVNRLDTSNASMNFGMARFWYSHLSFKPINNYKYIENWFDSKNSTCFWKNSIAKDDMILFIPSSKSIFIEYDIDDTLPKGQYTFYTKKNDRDNCVFQELRKENLEVYKYELYEGKIKDNILKVSL